VTWKLEQELCALGTVQADQHSYSIRIVILSVHRLDRFTKLIYMANLITSLSMVHRVDKFLYLVCLNRILDEQVTGFEIS
jgi:hypothetical protein